jgi:DNA-binding transcriptional regulator LsrR (DeoR family)
MATEGKTQQQIAEALDIPRETVSNVLERFGQNGGTAKKTKPPPEIPDLFAAQPDGDF